MNGNREYGDYQTPVEFAKKVCAYLKENRGINPTAVVEPTCGLGNFIQGSLMFDAEEYYGIEINPNYCERCRETLRDERVKIIHSDFFSFSTKNLIRNKSQILIIGNPPWVTNGMLTALGSSNLPQKSNFKKLKGIDAITGESNFDICEYIILQLIREYRKTNTVIAMLCKTSVARNVFKEMKRSFVPCESYDVLEFNASKVFGISAGACVLVIQLSEKDMSLDICNVYDFDKPETIKSQFGFSDGQFYSNLGTMIRDFDGRCCFEWRQGVKHDCSKVMELTLNHDGLQNGKKELVQIEGDCIFPLVKSSMFKTPIIHQFSKFVIVTQKKAREETRHLEHEMPKTWKYLNGNREFFEKRKSSIYRDAPQFSMFGVGDYSYSQYKVGVSGFYKRPLFSVLYSDNAKPVMTDDTSYFICFESFDMAYIAMLLLNSQKVQDFLMSIAFLDAKRPYTKKVLERIDFDKIVCSVSVYELKQTEQNLHLPEHMTNYMYEEFKLLLKDGQMKFA